MAASKHTKDPEIDKRIQQILECADKAITALKDRSCLAATLQSNIEAIIRRGFPLSSSSSLAFARAKLDSLGTQIWNTVTVLIRGRQQEEQVDAGDKRERDPEVFRSLTSLRVFAFMLIDSSRCISSKRPRDNEQIARLFKIALKTCRFSLDNCSVELALKVLERCAEYVTAIEEAQPMIQLTEGGIDNSTDQQLVLRRLVTEYYLLRIAHALKSERFDVAELFFAKVSLETLASNATLAEKAAELFQETGRLLFHKHKLEPSVTWCKRAIMILDKSIPKHTSQDAHELRLLTTATLIDALLAHEDQPYIEEALTLVEGLEEIYGYGNRIAVSLLRFWTLTRKQPLNVDELGTVLRNMIRMVVLTDQSFKLWVLYDYSGVTPSADFISTGSIMQTVHRIKHYSAIHALTSVREFIELRLVQDIPPDGETNGLSSDRLERAIVTYFMLVASQTDTTPSVQIAEARNLLDTLHRLHNVVLSPKATHAVQTLLWKLTGTASPEITGHWCKILQHATFDNSGQLNKARIGRKAITAALGQDDVDAAREAFFSMKPAAQNEDLTRLLAFKVAMKSYDVALAHESLGYLCKGASTDPKYLYACVLEAQQSGMRAFAIAALQALLDKRPSSVHLPSLLRCTVRLLMGEHEAQKVDRGQIMEQIVQAFESAAAFVKLPQPANDDQWQSEIQWWSKNAYNLALRSCVDAHPEHTVRLLDTCTKFLEAYPKSGAKEASHNVYNRKMICHFLSTTALMVLARSSEEGSEESLQYYLRARHQISGFLQLADATSEPSDQALVPERKLEMLKYQLEGILQLQHWNDLNSALDALLNCKGIDRWDGLADLLVIIHERTKHLEATSGSHTRIMELLQRCINETWKKDKDITKMSRWLRLAFSIYLTDDEAGLALKIVQQAASIAKRGYESGENVYPANELQWLACSAFNKAVDLLAVGSHTNVNVWIDAALEVARYAADNGALHAHLTYKREMAEERMRSVVL